MSTTTNTPVTVTDETFTDVVLRCDKPVLVDFWGPWCGPCRMLAPVLEEIAAERADQLTIAKLNGDENPATMISQHVRAVPALNLYRGGELIHQIVGAKPKRALLRILDEHLAPVG